MRLSLCSGLTAALILSGCESLPETARKLPLETSIRNSETPPSYFYCGNVTKAVVGPGSCESHATNENGPIPAFERSEIRGWIIRAPHWVEDDELGMNVLLDWGWQPLAEGVRPVNTADAIAATITPQNVIVFGRNAEDHTVSSSRLGAGNETHAWGGPFAAVVHVELQASRMASVPGDWQVKLTRDDLAGPNGTTITKDFHFPFSLFRPFADPPLDRDLQVGDYVRVVGTLWEDGPHAPAGVGVGRYIGAGVEGLEPGHPERLHGENAQNCWHAGSFAIGSQGRGYVEIHPVDYAAVQPSSVALGGPRAEQLEVIALCGPGEITREVRLDPSTKPAANAVIEVRKIDTQFTFANDVEVESTSLVADGADIRVRLRARGIGQGDPKYMALFLVRWKTP